MTAGEELSAAVAAVHLHTPIPLNQREFLSVLVLKHPDLMTRFVDRLYLDVLQCWIAEPDDSRPPFLTYRQIRRRLALRLFAWLTNMGVPIT